MTPSDADLRLHEWALWVQTSDGQGIGWPHATPFGRLIKPDPHEPREVIDHERAAATDRIIARLPGRLRHFLKVHYLDPAPTIAKARRAHLTRSGYATKLLKVQVIVALRLTIGCQGGIRAQGSGNASLGTAHTPA